MTDVVDRPTQDFLNAGKVFPGVDESASQFDLRRQTDLLRRILVELKKTNPEVLTSVVVQNTSANVIADQQAHQVFFQVGGKNVTIYKLIVIASTFNGWILNLDNPPANNFDGLILGVNSVTQFNVPIDNLYVKANAAPPSGAVVGGPAVTAGGLYLLGFTVPDILDADRE